MDGLIKESGTTIRAIVPAAGLSRRMGTPKQMLAIGGRSMLNVVVDTLKACPRIRRIAVVVPSWWGAPPDPRLVRVINDHGEGGMIDSVRLGLNALQQEWPSSIGDGVLVQPGDCPKVGIDDIERCIDSFVIHPRRIIVAAAAGRRGHPLIFPASYSGYVASGACDDGLRALPRAHPDVVEEVDCSMGVGVDIDTPEDYERLGE